LASKQVFILAEWFAAHNAYASPLIDINRPILRPGDFVRSCRVQSGFTVSARLPPNKRCVLRPLAATSPLTLVPQSRDNPRTRFQLAFTDLPIPCRTDNKNRGLAQILELKRRACG